MSWTVIDPAHQVTAEDKPSGLTLVRIPPPRPALPGRIQLQLDDTVFGAIDVALCRVEKRAVLERLAVQEKYRRRGAGRVLVAAALALGTGYDWSMVNPTTHWWRGCSGRAWAWCAARPPRSTAAT